MRITITGFEDINQSQNVSGEGTVDLKEIVAEVLEMKSNNLIASQIGVPGEHLHFFANVMAALEPSNQTPEESEARILKELVEAELANISAAYAQLEMRTRPIVEWTRKAEKLKKELIILKTVKEDITSQQKSNISGQTRLHAIVDHFATNMPNGGSESESDYTDVLELYNSRISTLKNEVHSLKKQESDVASRIRKKESELVAVESARLGHQEGQSILCDHIIKISARVLERLRRFSAFLRFPFEVLAKVFDEYIQDQINKIARGYMGHEAGRGVLFLAGICRGWQEVVYCSPKLWSYIPITFKSSSDSLEMVMNDIEFYLARASPFNRIIFHWSPQWRTINRNHALYRLSPKSFFTSPIFDKFPDLLTNVSSVELIGSNEQMAWPLDQRSPVPPELHIRNLEFAVNSEALRLFGNYTSMAHLNTTEIVYAPYLVNSNTSQCYTLSFALAHSHHPHHPHLSQCHS